MQNLIAALSIPVLGAETTSAAPSGVLGDSTFSETFVEGAPSTALESQPDDPTTADLVAPFSWPLIIPQKPAFLATTDAAVDTANDLPGSAAVTVGAAVPQDFSEAGPSLPALAPVPGLDAGTIAKSLGTHSETTPPNLFGIKLGPGSEIEKGLSPGVHALHPTVPAISVGLVSPEPVTNASATQPPLGAAMSNLQVHLDERATNGPKPVAEGSPKAVAGAVNPEINDDTRSVGDRPEPVRGAEGPLTGILNKPEVADQPSGEPTSGIHRAALEHRAIGGLKPLIWHTGGTDESGGAVPTDSNASNPAGGVAGSDLAADASAVWTAAQASLPSQQGDAEQRLTLSSFWERYFSDPAISVADNGTLPATGIVLSLAVPFSGSAVIPVVVETSGGLARNSAPSEAAASVTNTLPVQTAPKTATAPSADVFGKAFAGLVVSGWEEDRSHPDQGAEFLQPIGPTYSVRTAAGSPLSPFPALPVPHVASQLASVLVRNANSMTELALAPEELGRVRLRMEPDAANPDRLLILISVERPEILDLFRRHAGELAEAIRSAGYSGADIGFGQDGGDDRSEHRREPSPAGPGLPFEEVGQLEATRMLSDGASLDLRL